MRMAISQQLLHPNRMTLLYCLYFLQSLIYSSYQVLVQLSDIWRRLGRSADADRLLLETLSYEDLLMCRSLPRAHSTKERKTA